MRGTRIQNIVNELSGEKIDVVQWNPDLSYFIANSLSPARVLNVKLYDDKSKTAEVVVPDKQLSLAIGKEGQNARLAAKLTSWRIDIKSASEAGRESIVKSRTAEGVRERVVEKSALFDAVEAIINERDPIEFNEGELNTISEAVEAINLAEMAIARERRLEEEERIRLAKEAAKSRDILAEAELILQQTAGTDGEDTGEPVPEPVAGLFDDYNVESEVEAPAVERKLPWLKCPRALKLKPRLPKRLSRRKLPWLKPKP